MPELETQLRALAGELAFPPTPELVDAVAQRLAAAPSSRRRWGLRLAVALAVLVAAVAATLALSPGARSAFLEWLGIRGAVVVRVDELPAVTPSQSLEYLGEEVSLDEARRRAGFELVELEGAGPPDAVYVNAPGMISFVYGRDLDVRLILSQVEGGLEQGFILKKLAASGTLIDEVTVDGEPGLLLTGEPHLFAYVAPDGSLHDERLYLARDVLLWERGPLTLRLEGELTRAEALALADRVR